MMKTNILAMAILAAAVCSCNSREKNESEEPLPNILVLLADDLGYGDVGFHGSDIQTPNIDRIATEGVTLEQFYSCPMCSPTRAGLMTGRYPIRYGFMRSVNPPWRDFGLSTDEQTMPELLAEAGYKYRGIVGKWHLGHRRLKWFPTNRGFTFFEGCLNGAIDYFTLEREGERDWHENEAPSDKQGYSTDLIGNAAIRFIKSVPKNEPFFLYVPFNAPHSPFEAKEEDIARYPDRSGDKRIYAAMVDCMDQNIGRILQTIEERGQLENTFILFFSDNGGVRSVGDNGPLRGYKLTPYQGGIRVAAAAYWEDGGVTGGSLINERMGYIDVLPTLLELVHYSGNTKNPLDGVSFLPALTGARMEARYWFTYIDQNERQKTEHLAVNGDTWKLVVKRNAPDSDTAFSEMELFRIDEDPYETENKESTEPGVLLEYKNVLDTFYDLKRADQIPRFSDRSQRSGPVIPDWTPDE